MKGRAETLEQKKDILDRLLNVWSQLPTMRLTQLLCNAKGADPPNDLFYIEDEAIIEMTEGLLSNLKSAEYLYNDRDDCVKAGKHCSDIDEDGFCNLCGDGPIVPECDRCGSVLLQTNTECNNCGFYTDDDIEIDDEG